MGRIIAVVCAELPQPVAHHVEMLGFLECDLHPSVEEGQRHLLVCEPRDDIERQVDGVEFDMADGVQQDDATALGIERAALDLCRRHEVRLVRTSGPGRWLEVAGIAQRDRARCPAHIGSARTCRLLVEIGSRDRSRRGVPQRARLERVCCVFAHSARVASRTASAWPGTFTFSQICRITPSPSINRVVRATPMYLRPYMLFSTQTP